MNKKNKKSSDPFFLAMAGLALGTAIGFSLSGAFDINALGTEMERAEIQHVLERSNHPLASFNR